MAYIDKIIEEKITKDITLEEIHSLIYTGAITAVIEHKQKPLNNETIGNKNNKSPPWKRRLETKINHLRQDIGRLTQYNKQQQPSQKLKKHVGRIMQEYQNTDNIRKEEVLDLMKQKLAVTANRLRRYTVSQNRKLHNNLFQKQQKRFYQTIVEQNQEQLHLDNQYPTKADIRNFWSNI